MNRLPKKTRVRIAAAILLACGIFLWAGGRLFAAAQEPAEKVEVEEKVEVREGEEIFYIKEGIRLEGAEDTEAKDTEAEDTRVKAEETAQTGQGEKAPTAGPKKPLSVLEQPVGLPQAKKKKGKEKTEEKAQEKAEKKASPLTLEEKLEQKVDLSFINANLATVLSGISKLYEINMMVDKDVTGTVSVNFKDVALKSGLDAILKANDYSYTVEENILKVITYEELGVTEILQLDFISPDSAYDFVEKFVSEKGDIKINTSLNALVMTDQAKNIVKARELIKKIDIPPRQVLIEAKLVDITYTDLTNLGITWTSTGLTFGSRTIRDQIDQFDGSFGGPSSSLTGDQITLGSVINNIDTTITLDAMIQNQKAKVLASPSIIAVNNVEAKINIGEKVPIREETQTTTGTTETTRFVDVGITLRVTPRISSDEYLQLVIHPEVSSVSTILDAGPRITTREADTTALVRDRQTIVIAGLLQEEEDHNKGRVPILGSVPGFGWLFGNRATDTYQKELVIFITPYILPSPRDVKLAEAAKIKRSMLEEMGEYMSFVDLYGRAKKLQADNTIESRNKDYASRMKESARNLEEIVSLYPDDARAPTIQYELAGLYYSKLKDYKKAAEAFRYLLDKYPGSSYTKYAKKALKNINNRQKNESRIKKAERPKKAKAKKTKGKKTRKKYKKTKPKKR